MRSSFLAIFLGLITTITAGAQCEPQELQKLLANDGDVSDKFGIAVSISGDRVAVGAHREDTGGINAGAAYLFELSPCGC